MNNFQFLQDYQELQNSIMFDKIIKEGEARIGYCEGDKTNFWNFALVKGPLNENDLKSIESIMKELDRNSTIYFENSAENKQVEKLLKQNGYKFSYEDSWMFYGSQDAPDYKKYEVKKIGNENDLKNFLSTFDSCYQKNDPQNPYDELGDYLNVAKEVWQKLQGSNRLEYFLVFDNSEPVAVSTLTTHNGIGYISNVGSLKKVRGRGFGKAATFHCVDTSLEYGNKVHCLATEEGTYPNEFYKRIGFKTKFTGVAYGKN